MKKFTLLELLIVMSAVGILISILLPSLTKAKNASLHAASKSNLSQIYKYFMVYAKNRNNAFPVVNTRATDPNDRYWVQYFKDEMGEPNHRDLLLIPGQDYLPTSDYGYSPTQTMFKVDGRFLSKWYGRRIEQIYEPSKAFLLVEAKRLGDHAGWRIDYGLFNDDRNKISTLETTRTNYTYLNKMAHLNGDGGVHALPFRSASQVTYAQWTGLDL